MLVGSMAFVQEMVELRNALRKHGHKAVIPYGTHPHLKDPSFVENLDDNLEYCIKNKVMKRNFELVSKNDAILVVNHKRNGIDGYIGVSALMEMAIAHFLGKKIFLLFSTPNYKKFRWVHEVAIMQPIIINSDLTKIK